MSQTALQQICNFSPRNVTASLHSSLLEIPKEGMVALQLHAGICRQHPLKPARHTRQLFWDDSVAACHTLTSSMLVDNATP